MKKIILFPLFLAALSLTVFTSCSKDDDDKNQVNNSIIGSFVYNSVIATDVKTSSSKSDSIIQKYVSDNIDKKYKGYTWTFDNDSVDFTNGQETEKGAYAVSKDTLTIIWGKDDFGKYKMSMVEGSLQLEFDLTQDAASLELNEILSLGITDRDFKAEKAKGTMKAVRK